MGMGMGGAITAVAATTTVGTAAITMVGTAATTTAGGIIVIGDEQTERNCFSGPSGSIGNRGDRTTAGYQDISVFCVSFAQSAFQKGTRMRRIDLVAATMQGWSRLDPAQRERFFQAGLKAALRLDRVEFRAWLLRRLRHPPLGSI